MVNNLTNIEKPKEIKLLRRFEKDYDALPSDVKESVDEKLRMFVSNQRHPSLRVKKMEGAQDIWEMRVTDNYRITFQMSKDSVILRRVGTHDILRKP